MQGYGIIEYDTGDIYQGTIDQNKPDGRGKFTWANQNQYLGEMKNGFPENFG